MDSGKAWIGYACAVTATAAATLAGLAMIPRFDVVNVAMVYVSTVLLIALRFSRGPTLVASLLSVVALDLVFVPPQGVLSVDDLQYLFTFAIIAAIGLVVSGLRERMRRQEQARADLVSATETERIRSTLLASISHDLRTPLAVLSGASSTLAEQGERMSARRARGAGDEPLSPEPRTIGARVEAPADDAAAERRDQGAARLGVVQRDRRRRRAPAAGVIRASSSSHRPSRRPAAGSSRRVADRAGTREPGRQRGSAYAGRHRCPHPRASE
jgi:signal transduction histidine kinase